MATRRSDSYDDSGVDPEKFHHLRHDPSIDVTRVPKATTPHNHGDDVTALPPSPSETGEKEDTAVFPASVPYDSVQSATYQSHSVPPARRPFASRVKTEYVLLSKKKKIGILVGIVALLILIIGLAAGLSTRSRRAQNLPLPSNHGGPYTGDLTYYAPALGSCGVTSSSSDSIVAVSHLLYDAVSTGSNPNANPLCGKKIRARRNGRTVDLTVVDRCTGCKATDLDVTETVFAQLAEIDQGRVTVEWAWLEDVPGGVNPSSSPSSSSTTITTPTSTFVNSTASAPTGTSTTSESSSTTVPANTTTSTAPPPPPPAATTTTTTPVPETPAPSSSSIPPSSPAATDTPAASGPAPTSAPPSDTGAPAASTTGNPPAPAPTG